MNGPTESPGIVRWVIGRLLLTILAVAGTAVLSTLLGVTVLTTGAANSGGVQGAMVWPVLLAPSMLCIWWRPPVHASRKWVAWIVGVVAGLAIYFALRSPRMPFWMYNVEIGAVTGLVVAWVSLRARPGGVASVKKGT